jgi:phage terminase small subunit
MSDKLTPKQEAFVLAYLETGNASEAYRRSYDASGMADNVVHVKASELLKNGKVAVRVAAIQGKAEAKAVLDKAWVLERLMRNARIAMGEEKIKVAIRPKGPDGKLLDATVDLEMSDRDTAGANRALELLGKQIGMFIDRSEVGRPGDFDDMSDDELRQFITGRPAQESKGKAGIAASRGNGSSRGKPN